MSSSGLKKPIAPFSSRMPMTSKGMLRIRIVAPRSCDVGPMHSLRGQDRRSTRLNSSHTDICTLSVHDALPICPLLLQDADDLEGNAPDPDSRAEELRRRSDALPSRS